MSSYKHPPQIVDEEDDVDVEDLYAYLCLDHEDYGLSTSDGTGQSSHRPCDSFEIIIISNIILFLVCVIMNYVFLTCRTFHLFALKLLTQ